MGVVSMGKEDVKRYIEFEAPGMGVVDNSVSEVVCYRQSCEGRVAVDPQTIVPEDGDAVDVVARDPETHNVCQVEIYCSPECRNQEYSLGNMGAGGDGGGRDGA